MRRSKSQAIYKFLPGVWLSEKDRSGVSVTALISHWNYSKIEGIYQNFIENEIKRLIRLFGEKSGDISSFCIEDDKQIFTFVEPACIEKNPDIFAQVSPLVFYCSSCHSTFSKRNAGEVGDSIWICSHCKKKSVKQLQMVYSCECGYAQPVKIPYLGNKKMLYKPNISPYKMFYYDGKNEKTVELTLKCPQCQSLLLLDNAESGRNFKPFVLSTINLLDKKAGEFYEKGVKAQKTVVARWLSLMSDDEYKKIFEHIELAFSEDTSMDAQRKEALETAKSLLNMGVIKEENFEITVQTLLSNKSDVISVDKYVAACDNFFALKQKKDPQEYLKWIHYYAFKLMQFYAVKNAPKVITLEDCIQRQLEMNLIDHEDEILEFHKKLGIKDMQVSCDMEIITCTYGYTRKTVDPMNSVNKNTYLKLNAFDKAKDGQTNLVYGTKLETEGILFQIDMARIVQWLYENGAVKEEAMPDLEDDNAVKKWYVEYVESNKIGSFGEIDDSNSITKMVFGLLHSMSHIFIKEIGELSGLSSNSLTEILFIENASIFIYAQSTQGLPLGALSGLAESNYSKFLSQAYKTNKDCIFDPICSQRHDCVCSACVIIPEVSCGYFNSNLSRKYLYTIKRDDADLIGFWENDRLVI